MKKLWRFVGIAVLVAVVGLVAFGVVAFAQEPTQTPTPRGWARITDFATRLRDKVAARLGVTPEALDEAVQSGYGDVIDEALAEGLITEEQANWMRSCAPSGFADLKRFGRGGRVFPRGMAGWPAGFGALDTIAEKLGMAVEELKTELKNGKTVAELATAKGVELETIVEALIAPQAERLNQAVTAGRLTREQADQMLTRMRERLRERLTEQLSQPRPWAPGQGPRGEFKGREGFPGRGGFRYPWNAPAPEATPSQSSL